MRIFCLNESTVHFSRFLWNAKHCKSGANITTVKSHMNHNHAGCSQFLHMSCISVLLFCRLNCSIFTDDEGSDEELDDNFFIENERYFLFLVKVLPTEQ